VRRDSHLTERRRINQVDLLLHQFRKSSLGTAIQIFPQQFNVV
jgi:hypothetical protein